MMQTLFWLRNTHRVPPCNMHPNSVCARYEVCFVGYLGDVLHQIESHF